MLDIYKELKKIITKFNAENIDYALCGDYANAIHGFSKITQEIDFLLMQEDLSNTKKP